MGIGYVIVLVSVCALVLPACVTEDSMTCDTSMKPAVRVSVEGYPELASSNLEFYYSHNGDGFLTCESKPDRDREQEFVAKELRG